MKLIKFILEIIGWCQIALGVTAVAALPSWLLYQYFPSATIQYLAYFIIAAGFIAGSLWATSIWKKHGTIAWLGRITRIS